MPAQLAYPVVPAQLAYCALELRLPAQLAPGGHRRKVAAQLPPMLMAQRLPVSKTMMIPARQWPLKIPILTSVPNSTRYRTPYIAVGAGLKHSALSIP